MKNARAVLFAVLLLISAPFGRTEELFRFENTPGKLAKEVLPRNYQIELKPDLATDTLTGRETIEIEVLKPVDRIVLNALDLDISSATLVPGGAMKISFDQTNQLVSLQPEKPLAPGKHALTLEFRGRITETPSGMFSIAYAAPTGK